MWTETCFLMTAIGCPVSAGALRIIVQRASTSEHRN
jgi:hypothetical protein